MKRRARTGVLTAGLALAVAGVAWASPQQGFGNPDEITKDVSNLGDLLAVFVFIGYAIVGGYVIVGELSTAKETGRWGKVGVAIAAVLIVGFALWGIMFRAGQKPDRIIQKIQAR